LFETRNDALYAPLHLVTVLVTLNGIVSPTMPVLYMTHASALVLVASYLLSPLVCSYCLPLPSPCALGQRVNTYCLAIVLFCLEFLLFSIASSYAIVWTAYCLVVSIVLLPPYCNYLRLLLSSINSI